MEVNTEQSVPAAPVAGNGKLPPAIKIKNFGLAEYAYARFAATLQPGERFEDCLRPEFWAPVARQLQADNFTGARDKSGAVIEIRTVDHEFYAEIYVRAVDDSTLIVTPIRLPVSLAPKDVAVAGFERRWNVGKRAYDVLRKSDSTVVASGFKVKEAADAWIAKMKAA